MGQCDRCGASECFIAGHVAVSNGGGTTSMVFCWPCMKKLAKWLAKPAKKRAKADGLTNPPPGLQKGQAIPLKRVMGWRDK